MQTLQAASYLPMVKVTAQGDVTDQLGTVHQISKEPANRRERISQFERRTLTHSKHSVNYRYVLDRYFSAKSGIRVYTSILTDKKGDVLLHIINSDW